MTPQEFESFKDTVLGLQDFSSDNPILSQNLSSLNQNQKDELLIDAAERGLTALVGLALHHGANVHAETDLPLRWTATNGHEDTLQLLVAQGADIHAGTPFLEDEVSDDEDESSDDEPDIADYRDEALVVAAENGHTAIAAFLLDQGCSVHARRGTAIINAAQNGHTDTVQLLLNRGADIDEGDGQPLILAAQGRHITTAKLLLDAGANVHAAGDPSDMENSDQAIKKAISNNDLAMIGLLFAGGADIRVNSDWLLKGFIRAKATLWVLRILEHFRPHELSIASMRTQGILTTLEHETYGRELLQLFRELQSPFSFSGLCTYQPKKEAVERRASGSTHLNLDKI